ncbi:MAG: hypothetical protein H0Z38_04095 [Firmicutes bacterium]|nr:hypothetical protein [Bacillota bacterium]
MLSVYVDLHVHIGSAGGRVVKVTASRDLTVAKILEYVPRVKGLDIIGIVDGASPGVLSELEAMVREKVLAPHPGGGLSAGDLLVIPGVEMELAASSGGSAHFLAYFPALESIREFSVELGQYVTNPQLSTQKAVLSPVEALELVRAHEGFLVPAHAFTPHKGVLGCCASSLKQVFGAERDKIFALELGLSADTAMADSLSELADITFLTSSDAHSLPKIGREYMRFQLEEACFASLREALQGGSKTNKLQANYGLAPALGKYHRSFCPECGQIFEEGRPVLACPNCPESKVVKGVWDRLLEIADQESNSPSHRPPYIYQVPLEMLPGIGPKTKSKLIAQIGPEKYVLNEASPEEIAAGAGKKAAEIIIRARQGELVYIPGGGGKYGRPKLA